MHITWNEPRKLHKRPPPIEIQYPGPSHASTNTVMLTPPPTPEITPQKAQNPGSGTKRGLLSILKRRPSHVDKANKPGNTITEITTYRPPSPAPSDTSEASWHHHNTYFPDYEPVYPTTTSTDPYASAYGLTAAQAQAQAHAASVGHAIAIHYPMLPSFAEYHQTGPGAGVKLQGAGAWQSGNWGNANANWTGYGLNGERLPDSDGNTFGAPMPKGVPVEEEKKGGGGKKKAKGGEEGDEGGDEEGEEGAGAEGEAAPAAEGGEGAGGGGGGGKSSKNKKKKK